MTHGYDMRTITRVILDWPATLMPSDAEALSVVIRNLSMNGAFVLSEEKVPEGTPFSLLAEYMDTPIAARGTVNRVEPDGMALEFTGVEKQGFESLVDLLVENSDDPDAIRLEMLDQWKVKVELYD